MAVRPIVKYGDPVLARPADPVERFDEALRGLVADMVQTMYAAPGVGLAAPQIGVSLRLAVIDVTVGEKPGELLVLVNPEVVASEGEQEVEEGCLSVPDFAEPVVRPEIVEVRAFDLDGKEWTRRGSGLLARAFLHEVDHLDGRLYIDRLAPITRMFLLRRLKKKIKGGHLAALSGPAAWERQRNLRLWPAGPACLRDTSQLVSLRQAAMKCAGNVAFQPAVAIAPGNAEPLEDRRAPRAREALRLR